MILSFQQAPIERKNNEIKVDDANHQNRHLNSFQRSISFGLQEEKLQIMILFEKLMILMILTQK